MKILFISLAMVTLCLIFFECKSTYDSNNDSMRAELLILIAAGLAVFINHEFTTMELFWTFSIYLEAVAILPQLYMISKVFHLRFVFFNCLFSRAKLKH